MADRNEFTFKLGDKKLVDNLKDNVYIHPATGYTKKRHVLSESQEMTINELQ